jgi:hypothetical protein
MLRLSLGSNRASSKLCLTPEMGVVLGAAPDRIGFHRLFPSIPSRIYLGR